MPPVARRGPLSLGGCAVAALATLVAAGCVSRIDHEAATAGDAAGGGPTQRDATAADAQVVPPGPHVDGAVAPAPGADAAPAPPQPGADAAPAPPQPGADASPATPGPACGNGACETGESCGSCPSDCGACPLPDTYSVNPGESIQAAMDQAQAYARSVSPTWPNHDRQDGLFGRVIIRPGTHVLGAPLQTRAHVRIEAAGAEIVGPGTTHLMQVDDNGGGGYNAPATYWTVVGGVWNANGGGGFSIVHTRKFVLWDMEIKDIGYEAHHLEVNSSGGDYQAGLYNVVVHNVTMHGVATVHRLEDEAINIDYSWIGAAHNVAGDGTVTNNVLIRDCQFYDVPRAVSSHHFQVDGGAPRAKPSGITIQGGSFHDIDPSLAESGAAFQNDGAIRAYGWQNVLVENVTFTNCATAVSVYVPDDYPTALGSLGNFVVRNNTLVSCGRARHAGSNVPLVYVDSATAGVNLWDVQVTGNTVAGDWVAGSVYFVAVYDTHNCAITGNRFAPTAYSLADEKAHNKYTAQGSTNFGTFTLSGNTVSDGSVDNS
jgi:hypothetical protein